MAYIKHQWEPLEKITADRLNNIEDGIETAQNDAGDAVADVEEVRADVEDVRDAVTAIENETNSRLQLVWEHGGIDNATGRTNNEGSTSRSRDVTFYDGSKLVSVTNASASRLWIIFYTYANDTYTFSSSTGVDAGTSYTFSTDKFIRFDLRGGLDATKLVTVYFQSAIVEDVLTIKNTAPTEANAVSLLAAESSETDFLQFIFNNIIKEIRDANSGIEEINDILDAAPTDAVGESILQAITNENSMLDVLKSVIGKYIAQQEAKEDGIRIPEYFEENVENAIANYRVNAEEAGHDGDSFVFITDVHWGVNTKNSPALIKYILSKTNLRNVICGGDILDSGSKASELAKGYDFMAQLADIPGGLKTVIGNHDFNKNGHTDDPSYWFTLAQTYALFCPKAEMEMQDVQCIEPATGYYEISYYVDVPATNTRYLFVSIPFGSVYQATKDWVLAQLTNNPTKNFVMFSHFLMKNSQGEMAGGASGLMNAVKGFTNLKAWIFGHTHIDQVYYMSTGIPMISVDTDSSRLTEANPNTYTPGTITEQAFDIMTVNYSNNNVECARVGRGKNRRVNGGVYTVSVSGTLALTSAITPTAWESSDTAVATVANGTVTGVASGSATIKASSADKEEYWYVKVS